MSSNLEQYSNQYNQSQLGSKENPILLDDEDQQDLNEEQKENDSEREEEEEEDHSSTDEDYYSDMEEHRRRGTKTYNNYLCDRDSRYDYEDRRGYGSDEDFSQWRRGSGRWGDSEEDEEDEEEDRD